jgi:predicted nucleotidyltransferase
MPSKNKKPQIPDLSALLKELSEAGIEFVLVGGMAAVAQGAPVTTFDLDIVHRQTDENIKKLMKLLKSIDAYQRRPDDKIIEPDEKVLKGKGHILLTTRFGPLDVLAVIEEGRGFEELVTDTVEIEFQGFKVYVLSLETIVALKRGSKDPKDQYRLKLLEETLRQMNEKNEDAE